MSSHRPLPVRVSPETNPALTDDLEEKFPASLTFNPDPLSIYLICGFNLNQYHPELLRVADNRGDVTIRDIDQVSRIREKNATLPIILAPVSLSGCP
ncbi:MAG: hypothetical protein WBG50_26600 [Desulfomonilaceae bacterium]